MTCSPTRSASAAGSGTSPRPARPRRLYGVSTAEATTRGKQLFAELDLDGLWERQPKAMSGGQRRRLDIAMGLVHVPGLVFLDEPTTGLDPSALL